MVQPPLSYVFPLATLTIYIDQLVNEGRLRAALDPR